MDKNVSLSHSNTDMNEFMQKIVIEFDRKQ